MNRARALLPWIVPLAVASCSNCRRERAEALAPPADASTASASPRGPAADDDPTVTDLVDPLRNGAIDTAGPVVDLGERQSSPYLAGVTSLPTETVNGDSWVSVGQRLRLRVPLDETGAGVDGAPNGVRLRLRHVASRSVGVIVDGLLVRAAALPAQDAPAVITLPVPPDRFARAVAEVELRFSAPRAVPGVLSPVAAQIDWVQLARRDVEPARVADLVNDVGVEATPRRALTFYAPTALSTVMILPPGATWTASLAAEGPRGGARAPAPVVARLRAETDGEAPLERRVEVAANRPWRDVSLDLSPFGGRPARLSVAALEGEESRLAVAAPRLRHRPSGARAADDAAPRAASARHVVMVVVRGLRADRLLPAVSSRLAGGGFSRMASDGTVAVAQAAAPRELTALVSATTGLAADLHHVSELTDSLDDEAPTLAATLAAAGVATSAWTDDVAWVGSGGDRGFRERHACANDAATCRPDWMFAAAADALARDRDSTTFSLVVTRAGLLPLDPDPERVTSLDPRPYEGSMTPARTTLYALRARPEAVALTAPDQERLGLLYDASLLAVDRGVALLLDRIRDYNLGDSTLVIVVGDRSIALGEDRTVGDGPMSMGSIAETVFLARGPGFPAARLEGVIGVIDAAATALDAFGVAKPAELEGVSLANGGVSHARTLPFVASTRWDLGLRFGDMVALPRAPRDGGGFALFARRDDPLCQNDLSAVRPIARLLAESSLAAYRPGAGRRLFQPSTRVLPPPLEALLRNRR